MAAIRNPLDAAPRSSEGDSKVSNEYQCPNCGYVFDGRTCLCGYGVGFKPDGTANTVKEVIEKVGLFYGESAKVTA